MADAAPWQCQEDTEEEVDQEEKMMDQEYMYGKEKEEVHKSRGSARRMVRKVLFFFVASLSLTVVYYILFALLFSTETERRLERENEMFERELPLLQEKEALLSDVIECCVFLHSETLPHLVVKLFER